MVASFTDAWIETREQEVAETTKFVASFTDAWIETRTNVSGAYGALSRIFYRCVD